MRSQVPDGTRAFQVDDRRLRVKCPERHRLTDSAGKSKLPVRFHRKISRAVNGRTEIQQCSNVDLAILCRHRQRARGLDGDTSPDRHRADEIHRCWHRDVCCRPRDGRHAGYQRLKATEIHQARPDHCGAPGREFQRVVGGGNAGEKIDGTVSRATQCRINRQHYLVKVILDSRSRHRPGHDRRAAKIRRQRGQSVDRPVERRCPGTGNRESEISIHRSAERNIPGTGGDNRVSNHSNRRSSATEGDTCATPGLDRARGERTARPCGRVCASCESGRIRRPIANGHRTRVIERRRSCNRVTPAGDRNIIGSSARRHGHPGAHHQIALKRDRVARGRVRERHRLRIHRARKGRPAGLRHRQLIQRVCSRSHRSSHVHRAGRVDGERLGQSTRNPRHRTQIDRISNSRAHRQRLAIRYRRIAQRDRTRRRAAHRGVVGHIHSARPKIDPTRARRRPDPACDVFRGRCRRHHPAGECQHIRALIAERQCPGVAECRRARDRVIRTGD